MEPEPRSNQRLRAYFRPVRIPNLFDRMDHVSLRHSAAWLGLFVGTDELRNDSSREQSSQGSGRHSTLAILKANRYVAIGG